MVKNANGTFTAKLGGSPRDSLSFQYADSGEGLFIFGEAMKRRHEITINEHTTIHEDGRVTHKDGYDPEETARVFWEFIASRDPFRLHSERLEQIAKVSRELLPMLEWISERTSPGYHPTFAPVAKQLVDLLKGEKARAD